MIQCFTRVVWSEPKTDKLVLGVPECFVRILRHKTGVPSNSPIRESASVQTPLVSVDGIHDVVHMIGMSTEGRNVTVRRE
jgi:hypothetical protein